MNKERSSQTDETQQDKAYQSTGSNQPHPSPFKEPMDAIENKETPEEEAAAEQQRKEALTERD